jgi:predicted alpha/beta hydrolase family esterase
MQLRFGPNIGMIGGMKQAFLLHGTGGNSTDYFWFADTKEFLEAHGYSVWWPLLPRTKKPELQESLDFLLSNMPEITDQETIIIGHSSACPLILSLLEHTDLLVKQVVLVAGFYASLHDDGYSDRMLATEYDWDKIRQSCKEFILINSDNDPWGCTDTAAGLIAEELGALLVRATGQGHMGSGTYSQPYPEHTKLKELLAV